MARITVDDCLENVENRFDLVLKASARARKLLSGAQESELPWENDKPSVLALREIASGLIFNSQGERVGDSNDDDSDSIV